ncbi:transposase [Cellulosilyticum ruminicola]|uniref:transposase n=1 Tax=Cellulosilyticum ruminicola TaxID=425254 RepID=UPI0006D1D00C|nr:transposase [Cellulosilyticum ruminicola]
MHLHDINTLLNLQGVFITHITEPIENTVYITLEPTDLHQSCSICGNIYTIRHGKSKPRHVRHLNLFENYTILILQTIRLTCSECGLNFTWEYSFEKTKSKYTNAFKNKLVKSIDGGTVKHSVKNLNVPYTSGERFIKEALSTIIPIMQNQVLDTAINSSKLAIGIDDFVIRKGHTYNTGIYDLRNGALLTVVRGRKYDELITNKNLCEIVNIVSPFAVVMNLAKIYHNFVKEVFPTAIRIADCFHVNRYITDALHSIRKRVSKKLNTYQSKFLKQNKKLLERRNDSLTKAEQTLLERILQL